MHHIRCKVSLPGPDDFTDDVAHRIIALWSILVLAPAPDEDGEVRDERLLNRVGHRSRKRAAAADRRLPRRLPR
jgi:hypothetical protein